MNKYEMLDNISMSLGSLVAGKNKYFTEGKDSKKIPDVLKAMKTNCEWSCEEGLKEVVIKEDELEETMAYNISSWKGYEFPTIIYHHGAAEGDCELSFNNILGKYSDEIMANLIYIRAPFSMNNREFMDNIRWLNRYTFLLAGSTLIVEKIVEELKSRSNKKVIVTGASLGGFVTNLHYTYYSTADNYLPLLAGARWAMCF